MIPPRLALPTSKVSQVSRRYHYDTATYIRLYRSREITLPEWGGSGGGWRRSCAGAYVPNMSAVVAASVVGCIVYPGTYVGEVGEGGSADHLLDQLDGVSYSRLVGDFYLAQTLYTRVWCSIKLSRGHSSGWYSTGESHETPPQIQEGQSGSPHVQGAGSL